MKRLRILLYHPKNPRNLRDAAALANTVNAELAVVHRPGVDLQYPRDVKVYSNLSEAIEGFTSIVFFETYGKPFDQIIEVFDMGDSLALVFGAEDYGIPLAEIERVKSVVGNVAVARLTASTPMMSYNVVSSIAIALYVLKKKGILSL